MSRVLASALSAIITVFLLLPASVLAHPAWGIAVDRQGQVYFSDLETVWKIDAHGKLSVYRAGAGGRHVHDLNTDEAGNLYGVDNSYEPETERYFSGVWKITAAGVFSFLLPPTDNPPAGTSALKDRDSNTYHVTHYPESELLVLKRTPNGVVTALVGNRNAARDYRQGVPYSAGGLTFGMEGSLYFVHGANVSKLTTRGLLTPLARKVALENAPSNTVTGSSETQLFGIAVDAKANVFVADYGNRRIIKITPDGRNETLLRAEEPWLPTGVAVRGDELYILEYGHTPTHKPIGTRVRKMTADGTVSVLATVGENTNPTGGTTSVATNIDSVAATKVFASCWMTGFSASIFAVCAVIWRIKKK